MKNKRRAVELCCVLAVVALAVGIRACSGSSPAPASELQTAVRVDTIAAPSDSSASGQGRRKPKKKTVRPARKPVERNFREEEIERR